MEAKTLRAIRSMTAVNDHGGAYLAAATALGLTDLADRFKSINLQQQVLGHLPHTLYHERYGAYQELLSHAKAQMSASEYQRFYAAF